MTPIDNAMRSKNAFLGFAALVTAATAYVIWGSDVFPAEGDPKGDPKDWTREELRRWLANVSLHLYPSTSFRLSNPKVLKRDLHPQSGDTTEQLLARVKANMRHMP
ncbi:hypothetical protein PG996_015839 [Apiospora saccharicola]|uniref:Uncharacterized protein n=1 Tax=Apiospora saccharicola TaxID=335842 RepID=A0ABR1TM98_9PEZI